MEILARNAKKRKHLVQRAKNINKPFLPYDEFAEALADPKWDFRGRLMAKFTRQELLKGIKSTSKRRVVRMRLKGATCLQVAERYEIAPQRVYLIIQEEVLKFRKAEENAIIKERWTKTPTGRNQPKR